MKKEAKMYVQFMMDKLKEMYKGEYKSPFQIPDKKEQKKFHEMVKKEWAAFKKKAHVKQLDVINKDSIQEYFSEYLPEFDIKDIDMSYHLDRFDLSMWAHGKNHMYSIGASYPQADAGESYIEVYEDMGEGKKKKVVNKKIFDNLEKAINMVQKIESGKIDFDKMEEEKDEDKD
jgi:hypothetical protein